MLFLRDSKILLSTCPSSGVISPSFLDNNSLTLILIMIIIIEVSHESFRIFYIKDKQMIELKYNETSQLQVRLAILESQLKVANNKIKYLEKINKEEHSLTKRSQLK